MRIQLGSRWGFRAAVFLFSVSQCVFAADPPDNAVADADTAAVNLDAIQVNGKRNPVNGLALDEANQTGSRLGLDQRELPASVSVVTQEQMQLAGRAPRWRPSRARSA